jgi:hypothetical protein
MSDPNRDKHRQAMKVACYQDSRSSYQISLMLGMNLGMTSPQLLNVK